MTNTFHIQAVPGAPIACDMSSARDTPDERLAAYGRLFEQRAAAARAARRHVVFASAPTPASAEAVEDLARREAACCPFLDYRVETAGDEVIWTITNASRGRARQRRCGPGRAPRAP